MERLSAFRSRLIQASALICALLLQIIAGIMCVPGDLAPQGTLIGVLVAQERTLLPYFLMVINAVIMYIFILFKSCIIITIALGLSLVHGISFSIVSYMLNPYPSVDVMAVPFFAMAYWAFVGGIWLGHKLIVSFYKIIMKFLRR